MPSGGTGKEEFPYVNFLASSLCIAVTFMLNDTSLRQSNILEHSLKKEKNRLARSIGQMIPAILACSLSDNYDTVF